MCRRAIIADSCSRRSGSAYGERRFGSKCRRNGKGEAGEGRLVMMERVGGKSVCGAGSLRSGCPVSGLSRVFPEKRYREMR